MSRETRSRDSSNYQNLSASKSYRFFQPLNVDGKICDSKLFRRKGKTIEINVDNVFMPKKHNRKQLPKKKIYLTNIFSRYYQISTHDSRFKLHNRGIFRPKKFFFYPNSL